MAGKISADWVTLPARRMSKQWVIGLGERSEFIGDSFRPVQQFFPLPLPLPLRDVCLCLSMSVSSIGDENARAIEALLRDSSLSAHQTKSLFPASSSDQFLSEALANLAHEPTKLKAFSVLNEEFPGLDSLANASAALTKRKHGKEALNSRLSEAQRNAASTSRSSVRIGKSSLETLSSLETSRLDLLDAIADHIDTRKGFGKILGEVRAFTSKIDSLRQANDYVDVLIESETLSNQARQEVEKSPRKALVPYERLRQLAETVRAGNLPAHSVQAGNRTDGAQQSKKPPLNLCTFLQTSVDALRQELKDKLVKKLQQSLDQLGWPTPIGGTDQIYPSEKMKVFRQAFSDLLLLHDPAETTTVANDGKQNGERKASRLFPIGVLLDPLILRFRYHFEGKRITNRIEKPEWFFSHVIANIRDHISFLTDDVQGILDDAGFEAYNAKDEFIHGLVNAVNAKLKNDASRLLRHPRFLSHTIMEAARFDETLCNEYLYIDPVIGEKWCGTLDVLTQIPTLFSTWMRNEKEFIFTRYQEIINANDTWDLAYEDVTDMDDSKPTFSAERVCNMAAAITERYKNLPQVAHRIKSFSSLQLDLLEAYCLDLQKLIDSYELSTNPLASAVRDSFTGSVSGRRGSSGRDTSSVETALLKLCRWIGSIEHVLGVLKEWSDDVFFLELWRDISRAAGHQESKENERGTLGAEDGVKRNAEEFDTDALEEGNLFDDVMESYERLGLRCRKLVIKAIVKDLFRELKPYEKKRAWAGTDSFAPLPLLTPMMPMIDSATSPSTASSFSSEDLTSSSDLSPELCPALVSHAHIMALLAHHLPRGLLGPIYKDIAVEVEDWLMRRVVLNGNQFSERGGRQLALDLWKGLWGVGRRWVRKPENYYKRVKESAILLSLPTERTPQMSKLQIEKDSEPTLKHLVQILSDDEVEEEVDEKILSTVFGVHHLSIGEAKEVINRRVECGGWA